MKKWIGKAVLSLILGAAFWAAAAALEVVMTETFGHPTALAVLVAIDIVLLALIARRLWR